MDILAKNLLILASAGSGKTFQLANRVIGLVAKGVDPECIVALTFTRKAAGEFADSVLVKLANAADDPQSAHLLRLALAAQEAVDFQETLERVVKALPRLTFGTMDSFFSKVVRGFQYELGLSGGRFDLLEGSRAAAMADDLLLGILGNSLSHEDSEEFFHAFRRATIGREDQGVLKALREFVIRWQSRYQENSNLEWGAKHLTTASPNDWREHRSALAAKILENLDTIRYTRKGQKESLEKEVRNLESHDIGSGSLGSKVSSLMTSILDAVASKSDSLTVKSYNEFVIDGPAGDALRDMVELAAHCEFSAALVRTCAVRDVISMFDSVCDTRLRRRGLLGFNDVKLLMGAWARSEDARIRREAVDFRLDARIHHWLLDEFQDTSRADWTGLEPLIDEAASGDDGSLFIVGDRKQAIYAWRGGDVGLFDEVSNRYAGGLEIESIAESWRSCPEVLSLVNQVCGDSASMQELFHETASRWKWENHFSAKPLCKPVHRGQAQVEVVGDWDERMDRMVEILHELGVGQRSMTCGILLRGNNHVRLVADHLRNHHFDVIEEGRREPAKDNPVGIVISHLLKWLADPSNTFSREVVAMSPIIKVLNAMHGTSWPIIWDELTKSFSQIGFAKPIQNVINNCWMDWSDFGRRRSGDLLSALATLDAQGGVSLAEAADWIERLEISQSPGISAVQVMTIHKAKGLGFDVVLLPDIPDEIIPQPQYFEVAEGDGWLTQTPPKWARAIVPELRAAETRWEADQRYEAFCMLYVALTRAKRGLYVLLEPPAKSSASDKPSLSNWLGRSTKAEDRIGVVFEAGTSDWSQNIPKSSTTELVHSAKTLKKSAPQRIRQSPNVSKPKTSSSPSSPNGMKFGTEVHLLLEQITWTDESTVVLSECDAKKSVSLLLDNANLRSVFERRGRNIELFREQATDAIIEERLLTGVIDRLHVHRDERNLATKVEIIDFKTDAVSNASELIELYSAQMNAYRASIERIFPTAEVICLVLSVKLGELVTI
ncbi:MAG: UvrD-helicase domain-containing protein [Gloeobacteraceae cyanobacterium ES-bin-144]|nr:UvrD-helicase domain-containing protein [Verrucomicrobiales bacterium]